MRGSGKAVFPNEQALASNITRAFHKGLVAGEQEREGCTIWVNRDDALTYVTGFIGLARESRDQVYQPSKRNGPLVTGGVNISRHRQDNGGTSRPIQESGHPYSIVMGGDIIPLVDENGKPIASLTDTRAALVALKQLRVGLYREIKGKLVRVV